MDKPMGKKVIDTLFVITIVSVVVSAILFVSERQSCAQTITRIAVKPFTINANDDLEYLQRGITDMLISRLGRSEQVEVTSVLQPGTTAITAETLKGGKFDSVIEGSLTVMKAKISTDARVRKLDAEGGKNVLFFGQTGQILDDIIEHIDIFASKINAQLLNRNEHPLPVMDSNVKAVLPPTLPTSSMDASKTQNTDKLVHLQEDPIKTRAYQSMDQNSESLIPLQMKGLETLKGQLTGLATGDMDGDGIEDIVTITSNRLIVHRTTERRWVLLAEFKGVGSFVGVDTADLNGDGRHEIFVTSFDNSVGRVSSFVLEWDGKTLQRMSDQLPWYFRSVDIDGRGKVLLGQLQGQGECFQPGIFEITWQDRKYKPGNRLSTPPKQIVFGFARGGVRSSEKMEIVAYNSQGYVQILNSAGDEIKVSADKYGGSVNAITIILEEEWDEQKNIFLPHRILFHDLDADGIQEMLVINNTTQFGTNVLSNQRFFSKGRLEWLKWYGGGLRSITKTLDLTRFVADVALMDINGDGDLEIVAAVVNNPQSIIKEGSSSIMAFD